MEKRVILGHWRDVGSSLCRLPRPPEGTRRHRHQLHGHVQGVRRGRGLFRALRVQMDVPHHPSNNSPHCQPSRHCSRRLVRHQQRLSVMGASLRKAVLRRLGDRPPLSFPERSAGAAESDSDDRHRLVHSACLHFLPALGPDRPLHIGGHQESCTRPVRCQLLRLVRLWPPASLPCNVYRRDDSCRQESKVRATDCVVRFMFLLPCPNFFIHHVLCLGKV